MGMKIAGVLDLSTIDFPGKLCSVVFLVGCPFRCPYCHNHQLIYADGERVSSEDLAEKLAENYLIDGVCVTGGEPLLQEETITFAKNIRKVNLAFKLDTNGYYPSRLEKILADVDYIAIDVKTSPQKYPNLTGRKDSWERVRKSLRILSKSGVSWEARTTVVPGIVWRDEVLEIAKTLQDLKPERYVIQQYNNENPLDPNLKSIKPPAKDELIELAKSLDFDVVYVRCMEGEFEV